MFLFINQNQNQLFNFSTLIFFLPLKVKNKAKIHGPYSKIHNYYLHPDKKTKNNFTSMIKSKVVVYRKKKSPSPKNKSAGMGIIKKGDD